MEGIVQYHNQVYSFHEDRLAGRKTGPWVVVDVVGVVAFVDDELFEFSVELFVELFSCAVKRGKSFRPKFGVWSWLLPAVTLLQLLFERNLSSSFTLEGAFNDDETDIVLLVGWASSCCWLGCLLAADELDVLLVGVWFVLVVHPWLAPDVGIIGSIELLLVPISFFRLGTFAGGGILRALGLPRLVHPFVSAKI